MEIQKIRLVDSRGNSHNAVMRRWDESPDNDDQVAVEVAIADKTFRSASERGYFHAFCEIRRQLESLDLMPLCFAACENVYPSPMIEAMGSGEEAYSLTLGRQAKMCDLVKIFDTSSEIMPVSVDQQKQFYERWVESL